MRRALFFASIIVLSVLLGYSASGIRFDEDVMNLLPDGDHEIARLRTLLSQFGFSNRALFLVEATQGDEPPFAIADSLARRLKASTQFTDVQARWDLKQLQDALDFLREHRAAILDESDMEEIRERFARESIRTRLDEWKKALTMSFDPFSAKQMARDPLGLDSLLTVKLQIMQSGGIKVINGWLITPDNRGILVTAQPVSSGTDNTSAIEMVKEMDEAIAQLGSIAPDVRISWLAGHRFTAENASRIKRDVSLTVTISLIMIILLSILVYRRLYFILLTLVPALFGSLAALGITRVFIPQISAVIAGTGAMLIGIAVDYGIHLLYHIDGSEKIERREIGDVVRHLRKPLFLGAGTTLAAFLALQFSILPVYRHLGIFVGVGITASALFTVYVLPELIKGGGVARKPLVGLESAFTSLFRQTDKLGLWLWIPIAAISLLLLPGFLRVRLEGDLQSLNATSQRLAEDWAIIQDRFSGVTPSTLIAVSRENTQEALDENLQLQAFLHTLQANGELQSVRSIAALMPSRSRQQENILRWHTFFSDRELMRIRADFQAISDELRINAKVFDSFLIALERSTESFGYKDIRSGLLRQMISGYFIESEAETTVITGVEAPGDVESLYEKVETRFSDAVIYNGQAFIQRVTRTIYHELAKISIAALVCVSLFMLIFGGKRGRSFLLLLPLLVTLYWTFGILGTLGISVNLINCIVSIFIFGLVIDYCIFLAESTTNNESSRYRVRSGGAILVSALTTMFALGSLVLAHHPALHSLGLTALIGISSGLISVFLLVPILFRSRGEDSSCR